MYTSSYPEPERKTQRLGRWWKDTNESINQSIEQSQKKIVYHFILKWMDTIKRQYGLQVAHEIILCCPVFIKMYTSDIKL